MADPAPTSPPPRPWRPVARLLVLDGRGRLLLQRACEPGRLDQGEWWEVPGGGIEPGEDSVTAAVRELAEETGFVVAPDQVGPVCWTGDVMTRSLGKWHWASMVMHLARVDRLVATRPTAFTPAEVGFFLGPCWVAPEELAGAVTFPPGLADDLPGLCAGELIDAGFRTWAL